MRFLSFLPSVLGGGWRAAGCAVVFLGVCFSRLHTLGKLGSKYSFSGMDRKPQSFSLTVCCVIQLWNDGIIARSAHFKLPRVLTHILGKFHYSPCNPQSVLVRIFSSLPLFCPSEKAAVTVAEMSVLSDADCKIRQEILFDSTSAHQTEKNGNHQQSDAH